MNEKTLRIGIVRQYRGYESFSLLLRSIERVSPRPVTLVSNSICDIEIVGPYGEPIGSLTSRLTRRKGRYRRNPAALRIFHSDENTRFDSVSAHYSITSDLGAADKRHHRVPVWWSSINWCQYGINNKPSPRISRLIDLDVLLRPLGGEVLRRPRRAALFASHMREPRRSLYDAVSKILQVDGFGKSFDPSVVDHNTSHHFKDDVLSSYMFSLCPENSMYPGYYTEKVPESFAAGCIPLTWADQNVVGDFQPGSFVNLADFAATGYRDELERGISGERLDALCSVALLGERPDIDGYLAFVRNLVSEAIS